MIMSGIDKLCGMMLIIICQSAVLLNAQQIKVIDMETRKQLSGVQVYNSSNDSLSLTDKTGTIYLNSDFEQLYFSLIGYEELILPKQELEKTGYLVELRSLSLQIEEVLVSATKWLLESRYVPNKVEEIDSRHIQLQQAQTAADLLGSKGSVFIQKSQQGGGSPMIRGFSANRLLLVMDGVRMNNAIFRSGNLHNVLSIDPNALDRAEVIFGPGSLIYGSDAIGGVMSFHTAVPELREQSTWGGTIASRFSSANLEKTGFAKIHYQSKKISLLGTFSYNSFDDLVMGRYGPEDYLRPEYVSRIDSRDTVLINPNPRKQIQSGYDQFNTMFKSRYHVKPGLDIYYDFHYSRSSDIPRYDRLIEYNSTGNLRDGEWYYGPQLWQMHHVHAAYTVPTFLFDGLKLHIANQLFRESRHNRNFMAIRRTSRAEEVSAWSLNIDAEKKLDNRLQLYYGAEAVDNRVHSTAFLQHVETGIREPTFTRYPDGSSWAAYAIYSNLLFKIDEKWTIQGGVRYSYIFSRSAFDNMFFPFPFERADLSNGAITGSLGISRQLGKNWEAHINFSNGFKAPNIDDVAKVFDSEPGAVIVPNPELKPEYAYNGEIGIRYRIPGVIRFNLSAYYTYLQDAMVRRPFQFDEKDTIDYEGLPSAVLAIVNAASAYVSGIELGVNYTITPYLEFEARANYQRGEETLEDGSRAPLRHAGPFYGRMAANYQWKQIQAELFFVYNGLMPSDRLAPSELAKPHLYALDTNGQAYTPAWSTLNFKSSFSLNSQWTIIAGIENILDKRYRPFSSGITAAGRNWMLGFRLML